MNVDLDQICYKRNFLTDVIVRMDFDQPIQNVDAELPADLQNVILKNHFSTCNRIVHFFQFNTQAATSPERVGFSEWQFRGTKGEKELVITPHFLSLSHKKFISYNKLREEFETLLNQFGNACPFDNIKRLGLRYINSISLTLRNPTNWKQYVNSQLLHLFGFRTESAEFCRVFHNIEYAYGDHQLRFQFGMHNPDYPSPIRQSVFILDYDAYYDGLIEKPEILQKLDLYHSSVHSLFEMSITKKLRDYLNA